MPKSRLLAVLVGLAGCAVLYSFLPLTTSYAQQPAGEVAIDPDDISGVVTSPKGPEAGVWVAAP